MLVIKVPCGERVRLRDVETGRIIWVHLQDVKYRTKIVFEAPPEIEILREKWLTGTTEGPAGKVPVGAQPRAEGMTPPAGPSGVP